MAKNVTKTTKEKSVITKNFGMIRHAATNKTKDRQSVTALSLVSGKHSHAKFKKPVKVKTSVMSVSYSLGDKVLK